MNHSLIHLLRNGKDSLYSIPDLEKTNIYNHLFPSPPSSLVSADASRKATAKMGVGACKSSEVEEGQVAVRARMKFILKFCSWQPLLRFRELASKTDC